MQKLILLRGLPGAGKTTVRENLFKDFLNYEANMWFIDKEGRYVWSADGLASAHGWCLRKTSESLESGHDVIVTNTFISRSELKPYLELAERLNVWCTVLTVNNHHGGISPHDVPAERVETMKKNYKFF